MDADINFISISLITLIILLVAGTFFSAAEMAFSSLSRARIKSMEEAGGKDGRRAGIVAEMYEHHFDSVISTLLICNNTVAIATATVSVALFVRLIGEWGYLFSTLVISAVIVVFTDVFPKSMAKQQPEQIALFCAPTVRFLMLLLKPVNFVVLKLKNSMSKDPTENDADLSEEEQSLREQELIFMVEEAEKEGAIDIDDSTLITNAITFNDLAAWDIITPRVDIVSVPLGANVETIAETFLKNGYSRLPVYEDSLDNIKGVINLRDFLKCMVPIGAEMPPAWEDVITRAVFTVTNAPITDLLKLLKDEKSHMAIVTDEYGGTEGLVTMDDILERLVGDIWDEADEVIDEFVDLGENMYQVLCTAYIDDMFDFFGLKAESDSNTVGGWIMDTLRRIPQKGDTFTFENLTVTVTKADERRAKECKIEILQDE